MKYGIREICDVVLKAKTPMKIGRKVFYKDEPVIYFDTLKTSSLEGASTTVYAQGGHGNARLVSWDGEKTLTFTMEDALISPEGLMILSGAGLVEASASNTLKQHITEQTNAVYNKNNTVEVYVTNRPYMGEKDATGALKADQHYVYVMAVVNGEVASEPFLPAIVDDAANKQFGYKWDATTNTYVAAENATETEKFKLTIPATHTFKVGNEEKTYSTSASSTGYVKPAGTDDHAVATMLATGATVLVDYYTERSANTKQIEITAESFGGNFYLEASTLFRNQDGADLPAEFIIPNCKIQSNFTFSMASSGDPSTFTFTLDAFPGYTRFDSTKKVLCAIQVVEDTVADDMVRYQTFHNVGDDIKFN